MCKNKADVFMLWSKILRHFSFQKFFVDTGACPNMYLGATDIGSEGEWITLDGKEYKAHRLEEIFSRQPETNNDNENVELFDQQTTASGKDRENCSNIFLTASKKKGHLFLKMTSVSNN